MSKVDWKLEGVELSTCNCAWGCPCQFNAPPTHGHCRAAVVIEVTNGRFGDVPLNGLRMAGLLAWPGAIHEGHGEVQPIIDEKADDAQREALLKIMSGQETDEGATIFNVFAATYDKMHDPLFLPIDFQIDLDKQEAHFSIPRIIEAKGEPIRNPITGETHRARVTLPHGFEYHEAEYVSSTAKTGAEAAIPLEWASAHGHLARLNWTGRGVVHPT